MLLQLEIVGENAHVKYSRRNLHQKSLLSILHKFQSNQQPSLNDILMTHKTIKSKQYMPQSEKSADNS